MLIGRRSRNIENTKNTSVRNMKMSKNNSVPAELASDIRSECMQLLTSL